MNGLVRWWQRRRKQKRCFHHELGGVLENGARPAESWIRSELIDMGRAKLFECTECGRIWIA